MSETPLAAPAVDAPLQFEHAEAGSPPACVACKGALVEQYYEANGQMLCTACRDAVLAARTGGSRAGRFFRALGLGLAAALAGAVVYHYVRELSGIEFGLVYVAVGWLVGAAVARGANGRGGLGYQLLAVLLTWTSVAWSTVPALLEHQAQQNPELSGPAAVVITAVLSMMMPAMVAMESVMMVLITGFALWQAWKMNRRSELALVGPFALTPAAEAAEVTATSPAPEQSVA
ncbi:MAG TPA: hypothetical protein VFO83_17190 [Aggregicoccus sp.]|nr:hypothetical protein [Aggregicoccus sp.]